MSKGFGHRRDTSLRVENIGKVSVIRNYMYAIPNEIVETPESIDYGKHSLVYRSPTELRTPKGATSKGQRLLTHKAW